jgi:hypothetical protein
MRMRELARARPRFGSRRLQVLLRLEGLQLQHRTRRRKHISLHRGAVQPASRARERWSMDFVHDQSGDGRTFRVLTDRAIAEHGMPASITVDHGTEFTSRALDEWACGRAPRRRAPARRAGRCRPSRRCRCVICSATAPRGVLLQGVLSRSSTRGPAISRSRGARAVPGDARGKTGRRGTGVLHGRNQPPGTPGPSKRPDNGPDPTLRNFS